MIGYLRVKSYLLSEYFEKSFLYYLIRPLFTKQLRIFSLSLLFYVSLYFSTSNRSLLSLSLLATIGLFFYLKNIGVTLFLIFLMTLPFAKGKGYQIMLLAKEDIERYALFNLVYYFPLYLSDFFLSLLAFWYIRQKIFNHYVVNISKNARWVAIAFFFFCCLCMITSLTSKFPTVILLSVLQLLKIFFIIFLPFIIHLKKEDLTHVFSVISSALIFQSSWVILQYLHKGPLGKDIEVSLPGLERGIFSSENSELFRATGTFFEPSILGTFLVINIAILGFVLFVENNNHKTVKNIYIFAVCMGLIGLVFTGSRALYFLTLLLLLGFGSYFEIWNKIKIRFSIRHIVYTLMFVLLFSPFLLQRLSSLTDVFSKYGSATYRIQMAVYSTRLALTRFSGVGLNLSPYHFATAFNQENFIFDPAYPHNLFFQLLAETGFLGLLLFLLFLYLIFRTALTGSKKLTAFGVGSLTFLCAAQFYPIFINHPEISHFLFLYLGLYLYQQTHDPKR